MAAPDAPNGRDPAQNLQIAVIRAPRTPKSHPGGRRFESGYELCIACADATEFQSVIDLLKRDHGVRELRSRLVLGEVRLGPTGLLGQPLAD
jgi:hypothetical protein